jgi:hypothetical protein
MKIHARPEVDFDGDAPLAAFFDALADQDEKALVIEYGGRTIRPGYHVTEIKAGTFVTLDCGGNPDQWRETILQIEDIGTEEGRSFMRVGKFKAILQKAGMGLPVDQQSRVTFEISAPGEPMGIFDVGSLTPLSDRVIMALVGRPAVCKPRHRAAVEADACSSRAHGCCA